MTDETLINRIIPIVRYMIVCENWRLVSERNNLVGIDGLIDTLRAIDDPPYPLLYEELCVFLALTSGRGNGEGYLVCENDDLGIEVFRTRPRPIEFGSDPLEVVGVPYRIRDCPFPKPGVYAFQFWYHGVEVERRLVNLR